MTEEATLATPENMRAFERANPARTIQTEGGTATIEGRRCFAYSPGTDERFSATSGDYWQLADDEPLRDSEGEPMILAREVCQVIDAMSGEPL